MIQQEIADLLGIEDVTADDAVERAVHRINSYKDRIQNLYREVIRLSDRLAQYQQKETTNGG